ncbi:hypothetical protein C8J57DRAFT_1290250 [Mycena rebaudengoi]|nr:hypothetical protein C8J57DRAFT_1290250 [Mycena rebaudengoi]
MCLLRTDCTWSPVPRAPLTAPTSFAVRATLVFSFLFFSGSATRGPGRMPRLVFITAAAAIFFGVDLIEEKRRRF